MCEKFWIYNIMKHLIHLSLFESQNSEPVCDYYDDKKPDSGHFDFWSDFKKLNPEQKKAKFEEIITLSRKNPNIQLHFKQNHTKNILIRIGFKHFVWFGSGNSASNAEMEDYIWMMDTDIFNFKKNFLLNDN